MFEMNEELIEEQMKQAKLDREERKKNPPPHLVHLQQTTSLRSWVYRCHKSGIAYIPAKFCPVIIDIKDIFDVLDGKGVSENIKIVERWLASNLCPENAENRVERWKMWRWDLCAPHSIKSAMSYKKKLEFEPKLELDDPRFIDILMDSHRDDIDVCVRPWIEAEQVKGYPVEFRVFAFRDKYNNNEYSVSNYYPQRDLPEEYREYAIQCELLASKLSQTENFENGFTADFLLTKEKKLVFIEGGPAWGYGADPCCIDPEKMDERRIVLANEFDRGF